MNNSGDETNKTRDAEPKDQPKSVGDILRREIDKPPRADWKVITESCDPPEDEDTIKL